jgi:hypothetical protein
VSRVLVVAMPIRPCPKCHSTTPRFLEDTSKEAFVWYYRCQSCGHVWIVPKDNPDGPIRDVTVDPPK